MEEIDSLNLRFCVVMIGEVCDWIRRSGLEDMVLYVWISKFRVLKCGEILGNVQ